MNEDTAVNPYTLGQVQSGAPCCVPEPHLQLRDLTVSFHGVPVLSEVTLDIYRGCITALIGPSGCGKTTLLSALNRMTDLVPAARVTGTVLLNGQNIADPSYPLRVLRRQVGMIFQKPNPFPLSIRRNLELALKENGVSKSSELAAIVEQGLRDVGLWEEVKDRLDSPALALSGGQQQRLCIARALVLQPQVLLMDEPCSALDPLSSAVVEELIQSLRGKYTVVIVTHNLAQARRIANYAAFFWLRDRVGKLIEFGQSQRMFERPQDELTAAYIAGVRG
jgi:phosphate transport system ATP-binding protein